MTPKHFEVLATYSTVHFMEAYSGNPLGADTVDKTGRLATAHKVAVIPRQLDLTKIHEIRYYTNENPVVYYFTSGSEAFLKKLNQEIVDEL